MEIIDRKFLDVQTNSCHASTIAFYDNKPVFSWFGGIREADPSCAIYIQYKDKVSIFGQEGIAKWNPILFPYANKLYLFIKSGIFCDRWQTFLLDISSIIEDDFDISRVSVELLPAGLNGPVKTKPIVKNGIIYCGSSVETYYDWTSYIEKYMYDMESQSIIFLERSMPLTVPKVEYDDPYSGHKLSNGIIQPSLWMDKDSNLHAFFRSSRGLGKIYYSYSNDECNKVWTKPMPTNFDNPNASVDTVYYNGRLFLVSNPSSENRIPLTIFELEDQTFSIIDKMVVTEEVENYCNSPELSYPYMIEKDGKLHLTYTYGRSRIEHVTIGI